MNERPQKTGKRARNHSPSDSPSLEKSAVPNSLPPSPPPVWDLEERLTLTNLAQVAKALAISKRQFQNYMDQGCPGRSSDRGKQNGHFYLPEIIEWCRENVWKPRPTLDDFGDPLAPTGDGFNSPALEEYRKWRAKLAELDFNERNKKLVDVSTINAALIGIAQTLRVAGEQIARGYGNGPIEILNEALDEAEEQIREQFGRGADAAENDMDENDGDETEEDGDEDDCPAEE